MRSPVLIGLVGVLIANANAQAPTRLTVQIRFSTHQTCLIGDADIPCSEVGAKLHDLRIPLDADIHLIGDPNGKAQIVLPLFTSAKDSLERAGYSVKRGYITSGAP